MNSGDKSFHTTVQPDKGFAFESAPEAGRNAKRKILHYLRSLPFFEQLNEIRLSRLPVPLNIAKSHSLLSLVNLVFLQELARRAEREGIPGDFVECGVYRGGSAGVLGFEGMKSKHARDLWLYDAFRGMPAASEQDDVHAHVIAGQFVGNEEEARRIQRRLGVPENRVHLFNGWFEDTLPTSKVQKIALLHVDCDFYDPVKLVLETFYGRVSPAGFIVLNDYGSFQGCRVATDEFIKARCPSAQLVQIDQDAYFFQAPSPA